MPVSGGGLFPSGLYLSNLRGAFWVQTDLVERRRWFEVHAGKSFLVYIYPKLPLGQYSCILKHL